MNKEQAELINGILKKNSIRAELINIIRSEGAVKSEITEKLIDIQDTETLEKIQTMVNLRTAKILENANTEENKILNNLTK